jgi:siroheme synthase-like protein
MRAHPVFLCLEGRSCVAVGGDQAIEGKVRACLLAGAAVTVIAEDPTPALRELAATGAIRWVPRDQRPGDLQGALLAYASLRDPERIRSLREEAARERVLLNVIDVPAACDFLAPAVLARGELQVAVGTGGASPGLAARLRNEIAQHVGPEYGALVAILGGLRRTLPVGRDRAAVLGALLDSPLLELLRRGDRGAIDRLLTRIGGEGCTLEHLGVEGSA